MKTRTTMTAMTLSGLALLAWLSTGCAMFGGGKTEKILAATEAMAKRQALTEDVLLELARRGNGVVAETLSTTEKGGAVGWAKLRRALHNPDGTVMVLNNQVQYEEGEAIGKSATGREFGNMTEAQFRLAGIAFDHISGSLADGTPLEGLALNFKGPGTSGTTTNVNYQQVWADAPAKEKAAAAEAVRVSLEARKGLIVEVITATGQQAQGVLEQVGKATPYGAAAAAVQVVANIAGRRQTATVIEPLPTPAAEAQPPPLVAMQPDPPAPTGTGPRATVTAVLALGSQYYAVTDDAGATHTGRLSHKGLAAGQPSGTYRVIIQTGGGAVELLAPPDKAALFAE